MCGGGPCFHTFFGIPLQLTVIIIGVIELVITIIATILNVVKFAQFVDPYSDECEGKDVCIGPLIKYSVFDAFFGVVCALLLIIGAHTRNHCMLITWMVITFLTSIKYIYVVVTHDWTSLEDWISITYLLFYLMVFTIIWSFFKEVNSWRANTAEPFSRPYPQHGQPSTTVVINQTFQPQTPGHGQYPQVTTPTNYPNQGQGYPPPYTQQDASAPFYK